MIEGISPNSSVNIWDVKAVKENENKCDIRDVNKSFENLFLTK
jgi:hypothetical protein